MSVFITIAGLYAAVCLGVYVFQHRLIYYPESELETTPEAVGLSYRDVTFPATDGTRLHGWMVPAPKERGVILFCHGNAGNISGRVLLLKIFNQLGLTVFIFDYRGYGQSEGRPSEEGTYQDLFGAIRYLEEHEGIPSRNLILLGRSIGGAVASRAVSEVPLRGLILDSAFTSATEMGARSYRWLPVRLLSRYRYDSLSRMGSVSCPTLIIHSRDDELVPPAMGRRLYDAVPAPKRFLELRGTHADSFQTSEPEYRRGITEFLDSLPSVTT